MSAHPETSMVVAAIATINRRNLGVFILGLFALYFPASRYNTSSGFISYVWYRRLKSNPSEFRKLQQQPELLEQVGADAESNFEKKPLEPLRSTVSCEGSGSCYAKSWAALAGPANHCEEEWREKREQRECIRKQSRRFKPP